MELLSGFEPLTCALRVLRTIKNGGLPTLPYFYKYPYNTNIKQIYACVHWSILGGLNTKYAPEF